jgi:uncharacterized repeat protein (TIGR03803 family)
MPNKEVRIMAPGTKLVASFLFILVAGLANAAQPNAYKVLHNFSGADGGSPNSLMLASDGFFYGSTANGGDVNSCPSDGCGLLFKSDSAGHVSVLHVFHATDGYSPTGMVQGSDGNFYGTTISGGQPSGGGGGTFFRMDPAGNVTVLYAFVGGFACCDGAGPSGPPVQANDGNFYGTTGAGGAFRDADHPGGFGTFYQFNPVSGLLTILHSFDLQDNNGIFPNNPLLQASDGFLYGTTNEGAGPVHTGGGTAFRVDTSGNLSGLAVITQMEPMSSLIQAKDGFLYGVGQSIAGSVYRLDTDGKLAFINRFDGIDGTNPHFGLVQATDGFLYGTTSEGGLLDVQGGDIFRISTAGGLRVMHSFVTTDSEGFSPTSILVQGADGFLYGVTGGGGVGGRGTMFRLNPRAVGLIAAVSVNPTTIHSGQTSTGTVTLSSPAPAGGTLVSLGANSFQMMIPASVLVPAGAKTATFTIKALKIGSVENVRVYASFNGQGVRTNIKLLR